jgi:DNA modification methylase
MRPASLFAEGVPPAGSKEWFVVVALNVLYFGDNQSVLQNHVADNAVDLVYLDPPFNSRSDYHVVARERSGAPFSVARAFRDFWCWDEAAQGALAELLAHGGQVGQVLQGFQMLLGPGGMLAYLTMMAPRLCELRRVLKPTGSIYLHCDPAAGHYLRVLLDAVFGPAQFRNQIVWRRTGAHGPRRSFGPVHDTILFYTRTSSYYFKTVQRPYMRGHVTRRYRRDGQGRLKFASGGNVLTGAHATAGESGQPWRGFHPAAKNRHWAIPGFLAAQMPAEFAKLGVLAKLDALYDAGLIEIPQGAAWPVPVRYLDHDGGQPLNDLWTYQPYTEGTVHGTEAGIDADVAWLGPTDPERLGYQTQKPLGLLERIILSSCPEGGVVLDPFCGSGTTLVAAHGLQRPWLGIDMAAGAIALVEKRLRASLGLEPDKDYRLIRAPSPG